MKSANQQYKESGSTLKFNEWITREKAKNNFIPNVAAIDEYLNADGNQVTENDKKSNEKDVDRSILIRNIVITAAVIGFGIMIYKVYSKKTIEPTV